MAVHGDRDGASAGVALPSVVPLELAHLTRLSWELGARVVGDGDAARVGGWEHVGGRWALTVYRVTGDTGVVRVRTPAGRERFYGVIHAEVASALPGLDSSPAWRRTT